MSANLTINAEAAKDAKKTLCFSAAFALAKPKLAESLASEGWAFAFYGVGYSDTLPVRLATAQPSGSITYAVIPTASRRSLLSTRSRISKVLMSRFVRLTSRCVAKPASAPR